jgi:hypothetical protein
MEPATILSVACPREARAMPIFYINFRNGDQIAKDDVGQDLPGLEEAKAAAMLSAREIIADDIKGDAKNPLRAVIITDESGQDLMTILAKDVLPAPLK